ncbi:MAG: hypothetical protein IKZ41_07365 [Clostridia bacterium]|nr:hypothetical protein [Clostridia bacterium]MBR5365532.1 hypothetical protein [Clostridia bacterium]
MNAGELKAELKNLADITFVYNGKNCGCTNEYRPPHQWYDVWYGETEWHFIDVDELMTAALFDGKSLENIAEELIINIS